MSKRKARQASGFTLVELLIYIALSGIVLTGLYSLFITNSRSQASQENSVEMTQEMRSALAMMVEDIRVAGCDPTRAGGIGFQNNADDNFDTDGNSIHFTMDTNDDGATGGAGEDINYFLYTLADGIQRLGRRTANCGSCAASDPDRFDDFTPPLAENITGLSFTYTFADGDTGVANDADGDDTNDLDNIRVVHISLTAQTPRVDPVINQRKSRTLTASSLVR
ncbi:PilW family protein, partial [Thermodesulfobacteriota bacterium]